MPMICLLVRENHKMVREMSGKSQGILWGLMAGHPVHGGQGRWERWPSWGCTESFVEAVTVAPGVGKIPLSSSIIGVRAGGDRSDGMFSNSSGSKMGSSRPAGPGMGELEEGGGGGMNELDGGASGMAELDGGGEGVDRLREGATGVVSMGGSATFVLLSATASPGREAARSEEGRTLGQVARGSGSGCCARL